MVLFLDQLAAASSQLSGNIRQSQRRHNIYFDQKIQTMPNFSTAKLVYVDCSQLITFSLDRNAGKYNRGLPTSYESFQILQITDLTLMMDENDAENNISIDQTPR